MSDKANIVAFPDTGSIDEVAATWVARMDTGALSPSDRTALAEWMKQSPLHRESLERMSAVWGGCDVLDDLNLIAPLSGEPRGIWTRVPSRIWIGGAIAACVLVVMFAAIGQLNGWFIRTQTESFITAVGKQRTIHLVDGSTIVLNTNSEIDVNLQREIRSIKLIRGEANFDVAKDAHRPFFVYAGDNLVRAVGTAFAVYVRAGDVEVTVSEGVVELLGRPEKPQEQLLPAATPPEGSQLAREDFAPLAALTANETAILDKKVKHIEKLSKEAVDQKLLWRDGLIGFKGEPLSFVVAEVSRYTNVKIEIEDPTLKDTPIGGFFVVGDIDGLLQALQKVFHIEARYDGALQVKLRRQS